MARSTNASVSGSSDDEDPNNFNITVEITHNALLNTTSDHVGSQLKVSNSPSEATGSFSEINPTASSEVAPFIDLSISASEEVNPPATSEETVPRPRLHGWGSPDGETASETVPFVAHSPVFTQSPETMAAINSESPTNPQSDSSSESYLLVSAEDTFDAGTEMFTTRSIFTFY